MTMEPRVYFFEVVILLLQLCKMTEASSGVFGDKNKRREPNNVQCFKNADCISDCCISNNGWVGVCVGRPVVGQVCGLFSTNPQIPGNMKAWKTNGILTNLMGSNGVGSAGAQAAAAFARSRTGGFGLAYGPDPLQQPSSSANHAMGKPASNGVGSFGSSSTTNTDPRASRIRVQASDPYNKFYPHDSRIAAYQLAGGYGGYGSNPNYFGLGGRN